MTKESQSRLTTKLPLNKRARHEYFIEDEIEAGLGITRLK